MDKKALLPYNYCSCSVRANQAAIHYCHIKGNMSYEDNAEQVR